MKLCEGCHRHIRVAVYCPFCALLIGACHSEPQPAAGAEASAAIELVASAPTASPSAVASATETLDATAPDARASRSDALLAVEAGKPPPPNVGFAHPLYGMVPVHPDLLNELLDGDAGRPKRR
jgi:hypothetical protein